MNNERKTKKQLAEEVSRLGERLDLFQGLVENSPDAIVMSDAQGRITYFSPGAEALTGWTAEEISSMRAADFYQGGAEEAREVMRLLREEGQLRNYQVSFKAKDGTSIEVYASFSLLYDSNGEFSGTLVAWKDFSERRQAEEALRETEDRYRGLFEDSQDAIGIVTADGRFLDVNQSWLDLLGATREQAMEMNAADFYVDTAGRDRLMDEMARHGSVKDFEYKLRRLDGREIYVQLNITSRQASDGTMVNQTIARDVTQRKWAEALEEVVQEFTATLDYQAVAQKIADNVCTLLGALTVNVFRLEGGTGNLVPISASGLQVFQPDTESFLSPQSGISGLAVRERQAVVSQDMLSDPRITYTDDERAAMEQAGLGPSLSVPLIVKDRVIGAVTVGAAAGRDFKEEDIDLVRSFAGQAALALENARLLDEADRERQRSEALYEISNRLAGVHDTDEVLDLIVNEAARLLGAPAAYLRLVEDDQLVAGAATQSAAAYLAETVDAQPRVEVVAETTNAMGRVMATKKPMVIEDAANDETLTSETRLRNRKYGFHGAAAIPLLANGRSIGVLAVMDNRIRRFTDDEVSLLMAFADQASLALDKARLLNEAEREKERSDALYQISNKLAGAHDTDEVLDLIVNEAAKLVGSSAAYIRLLEGEFLVPSASTESLGELGSMILVVGEGIMGHVMASKKPWVTENMEEEELLTPDIRKRVQASGFLSAAAVPLLANDISVGVLAVMNTNTRRFTDDEVSLLTAFADQAALALDKARLLNEAERERGRLATLNDVVSDLATTMDFEAVSQKITDSSRSLIAARIAIIFQLDESTENLSLISVSGDSHPRFTQDFSLADLGSIRSLAARKRQTLVMTDLLADERLTHTEEQKTVLEQLDTRAFVAVPFIVQDRVTGVLTVGDLTGRVFTDDEIQLTEAFADQAALALDKARLLNEAEREKERSDALYQISNKLAGAHDTDEVLDLIVNEAARLLGLEASYIRLLSGDSLMASAATEGATEFLAEL
ncbi:MAG: GAF domain-containing protein, partial [Chloroflexi bacterium]|nr:GAF domain-containing protein [Chloroflexota bacterium]